jgi:hypothetical protein
MSMFLFVVASIALAVVWLASVAIDLCGEYPRRRYWHKSDDIAKAALIAVYVFCGLIAVLKEL